MVELLWSGKVNKKYIRNSFNVLIAEVERITYNGEVRWAARAMPGKLELSAEPFTNRTDAFQAVIDAAENGEIG